MKPKHIISIILAIVVVAGLIWWASANRTKVSVTPPATNNLSAPLDQMADWKTYRNEQWKIEFQYPPELTPSFGSNTVSGAITLSPTEDKLIEENPSRYTRVISLQVLTGGVFGEDASSIEDFRLREREYCEAEIKKLISRNIPVTWDCENSFNPNPSKIFTNAGVMGEVRYTIFYGDGHAAARYTPGNQILISFVKNGIMYTISHVYRDSDEEKMKTFQIAKTFRFINP